MKLVILSLIMSFNVAASGHCPNALEVDEKKYCYEVEWLKGEKRQRTTFVEVSQMSPVLNLIGELPQKRIFSKLNFKMWIDGDKSHLFAAPNNFSVEPYMLKSLDHEDHGLSHEVSFVDSKQALQISRMPLRSMRGCWSLVWKKENGEITSLINNFIYTNLSPGEQVRRHNFCSMSSNSPKPPKGDHSGHH